ncbi:hypothetical protein BGZ58_004651 [Dissophora ornata]|nr:hypothetical protein BGZ58_004651 [Dissophora ornata]
MDPDMSKYASLLQAAKADQELGDLKSAYSTYLKAHATIMRVLGTQIVFKDHDSLESIPDNYTQLFAHAQEILRRIKDIVDQSKAHAAKTLTRTASSSTIASKQQQQQAKLLPSITARPGLSSSHPSQRSIATISQTINRRTKKNVPMIPISPLTRQALLNTFALSQATQRFEQAKQGSSPHQQQQGGSPPLSGTRDLANLRRLIEDIRIQRAKLDAVNIQIQSVATSTITSWDPDMIARQLTIVDAQLFKEVAIPKDLVRADRKSSAAQHCIDFETYVAHSVAHLLLLEWSTIRQRSPVGSPVVSKNQPHTPTNAVAHMIRVAHILLNVYRNFNGFMAVMRALTSPEIKRMHKLWSGVNSKTKDSFKRLVSIFRAQDDIRCYKEALIQKLDAFQDVGKDAVVAIPWMRYHMDEVKSIINSYLTGHESTGNGSTDIVLSAPGARKLSAVTSLLIQCRTNESSAYDHQDGDGKSQSTANTKHRELVLIDGLKTPLTPIWDLISLGAGDITLHHWLLSRPFLNKQQLIDESLEIEPLFNGEELPCYDAPFDNDNSEDSASMAEDLAQDDSFEHVIAPEHDLEPLPVSSSSSMRTPKQVRPSLQRAPVSETEINDIMNELLNEDASDSKGLFDDIGDVDSDENIGKSPLGKNQESGRSKSSPGRSRDVLQFLGIDPGEYSDNSEDDGDLGSGDIARKVSVSAKGKGKATQADNDIEEINDLLAQVKGLVHESRAHVEEVEFTQASSGLGLEDGEQHSGRTLDPFQQGAKEEEFEASGARTLDISVESPPTLSILSLDALRRQLEALDQGLELKAGNKEENEIPMSSTTAAEATSPPQSEPEHVSPKETDVEEARTELSTKTDPLSSSSSSSASNPFALFMIKKPTDPVSSAESPFTTISKGRRRKIHTDRSGHFTDPADGSDHDRTGLGGFSPPRPNFTAFGLSGADDSVEAIAARAKMSLASHGEKKPLDKTPQSSTSTVEERVKMENEAAFEPCLDDEGAIMRRKDVSIAHAVSIEELDKKPLDTSSPPSFKLSTSSSASASTATTAAATLPTMMTTSHAEVPGSKVTPFPLETSLFRSTIETAPAPTSDKDDSNRERDFPAAVTERGRDAGIGTGGNIGVGVGDVAENAIGLGDKSPPDSTEGGRARSRQRRRIAGALISVPPMSLISKASTSSLSGAFHETITATTATTATTTTTTMTATTMTTLSAAHLQQGYLDDESAQGVGEEQAGGQGIGGTGDDSGIEARIETHRNSDDITILAGVEVDVSASKASSLLTKSPPEVAATASETVQTTTIEVADQEQRYRTEDE